MREPENRERNQDERERERDMSIPENEKSKGDRGTSRNHRRNWSKTWWLLAIAMKFEQWSSWRFSHGVLEKDLIEERKEESFFEI